MVAHPLSTYSLTGLAPVESNWPNPSNMETGASSDHDTLGGLISPQNPLFVFGLILGVTFGLVGVSGSLRLGKAKASASLDRS